MKRLLACLLALLLPFTTCCASGFSSVISAMETAKTAAEAQTAQTAQTVTAEGFDLTVDIQSPGGVNANAKGFLGMAGESLYLQADTPWLKPFTLRIDPEKGLYLWNGEQWYAISLGDMPAAAQGFSDPEQLAELLQKDLEVLAPVLTPAFAKLPTSPAVVLAGMKLTSMMEEGVFSISGTDLNMVLYEVWLALEAIDKEALAALTPQLQLGDVYLMLIEELPDLVEDLAEMEFQLKGNLSDDDQGFVSLVAEDFEFTVNYRVDDATDSYIIDGTVRVDNNPCAFKLSLGREITLDYSASNVRGNVSVVAVPRSQTYSVSGSHYFVHSNGRESLEFMWSADLALMDNGLILAFDLNENYRGFVDFRFEEDAATGSLLSASLSYKDVNQEHALLLLPTGAEAWTLTYTQSQMGKVQGTVTAAAALGTAEMPALTGQMTAVTMEQAAAMLELAQETPNP